MTAIAAVFRQTFGAFVLDAEFTAPARGVTALYGASGAGKTLVLRCVAGLTRAAGSLYVNGECWQDDKTGRFEPTHRRAIGYVFQEPSLFPHLDVRANLEYGFRRTPVRERRIAREHVIELLGVTPLLARSPANLSGGERQRVAIARALLASPRLLLMDEPLSALDRTSKAEILPYLERLHAELSIPVLYVSHSPDEVARLADHLVLLSAGRVVAQGALADMLARLDLPLAQDEEAESVLEVVVAAHDEEYALSYLDGAAGRLSLPRVAASVGERVRVRICARDVSITLAPATGTSVLNILPARVVDIAPAGPSRVTVRLNAGGDWMLARITRKSAALLDLAPGRQVYAQIKSVALAP